MSEHHGNLLVRRTAARTEDGSQGAHVLLPVGVFDVRSEPPEHLTQRQALHLASRGREAAEHRHRVRR